MVIPSSTCLVLVGYDILLFSLLSPVVCLVSAEMTCIVSLLAALKFLEKYFTGAAAAVETSLSVDVLTRLSHAVSLLSTDVCFSDVCV